MRNWDFSWIRLQKCPPWKILYGGIFISPYDQSRIGWLFLSRSVEFTATSPPTKKNQQKIDLSLSRTRLLLVSPTQVITRFIRTRSRDLREIKIVTKGSVFQIRDIQNFSTTLYSRGTRWIFVKGVEKLLSNTIWALLKEVVKRSPKPVSNQKSRYVWPQEDLT